MNEMQFNLFSPTHVLFGAGKLAELGAQPLPGRKALLLLSSGSSAKKSGALDIVTAQLAKAGVDYVPCPIIHENSTKDLVMDAAKAAREIRAESWENAEKKRAQAPTDR